MSSRKKGKRKGPRDFDVAGSFQGKKMLFTLFKVRAGKRSPGGRVHGHAKSWVWSPIWLGMSLAKNEVNEPNRYT